MTDEITKWTRIDAKTLNLRWKVDHAGDRTLQQMILRTYYQWGSPHKQSEVWVDVEVADG